MLIMIDDVQFKDKGTFFDFISRSFGKGADGIDNLDTLYDIVSEFPNELEIILNDYDDVIEEMQKFAKQACSVLVDGAKINPKVKLTFMHDVGDMLVEESSFG